MTSGGIYSSVAGFGGSAAAQWDKTGCGGMPSSPRVGHLAAGEVYALPVRGVAGVPQDATVVLANVTAMESTGDTAVTAFGQDVPGTTTVQVGINQRRSNLAIVPIAEDGKIRIRNATGLVNVAVDIAGWFGPGQGGRYVPLQDATRVVDTGTGLGVRQAPLGAGETVGAQIAGLAGVSRGATAAVMTISGTEDMVGTELSVAAPEAGASTVTAVSIDPGSSGAGTALPALGASGRIDVRSERGNTRMVTDVAGYFVGGSQLSGPGNCVAPANETGFTSILDGRAESSKEGWVTTGGAAGLQADGCELITNTANSEATWYPVRTYRNDYTLRLDWKDTGANADSGVLPGFPNPVSWHVRWAEQQVS